MVLTWLVVGSLVAAPAPGRPAPPDQDIAAVAARLDALHVRITGNREELEASELINYHRVEGGVARCMRAAGKQYRIRPFVSGYDGFTDADLGVGSGSGSVFDSITDRGRRIIRNELAAARLAPTGVLDSWGSVRAADSPTLNRCTAPYGHQLYLGIEPPAGVYQLSHFPGLFDRASRDPAVLAAMRPYRTCMKQRYGYDVTERTDFLFAPRLSYQDAPIHGRPATPAWHRGVRQIRAAFAADIACRLPAYRLAMRLIAPHVGAWEREHRAEIRAVRAAWRQRVEQARTLPRTIT
jgi:hypothetical protein